MNERASVGPGTYRKSISSSVSGGVQSTRMRGLADRSPFSSTVYRRRLLSTMRLRRAVFSAAFLPSMRRESASRAGRRSAGSSRALTCTECLEIQDRADRIS